MFDELKEVKYFKDVTDFKSFRNWNSRVKKPSHGS